MKYIIRLWEVRRRVAVGLMAVAASGRGLMYALRKCCPRVRLLKLDGWPGYCLLGRNADEPGCSDPGTSARPTRAEAHPCGHRAGRVPAVVFAAKLGSARSGVHARRASA